MKTLLFWLDVIIKALAIIALYIIALYIYV